jgi:hypothetical protein
MARVTAANSPIHDHDLAYARYLLDGLEFQPELTSIADSFYDDAHAQLRLWSGLTGYTVEQCAAVTALYSANTAWPDNVIKAHNAIVHGLHSHFPMVTTNARAILNGAPISDHLTNGPKVNNFYKSLLRLDGCRGANDRWIFRIFNRPQGTTWYKWVDRCLDILASEYGVADVSTLQARLWYAVILDMALCGDRGAIQSCTMLGIRDLDNA